MIFASRSKQAISRVAAWGALAVLACQMATGQQTPSPSAAAPTSPANNCAPMHWTAAEYHRNMMDQLGIKALRPGPSGNESEPNHANYDEAAANPFPNLPEVLTLQNGQKVTTASMWWNQRRPEIVEDFEREVLGRIPKNAPKVIWEITKTAEAMVGNHPVIGKQLLGHVDNSSDPDIQVDIQMTLVLPADAKGPVPVMMMFGGRTIPEVAFPAPVFPGPAGAPGRGALAAGRGPVSP